MHRHTLAGPRRRTRRAVLAAALAAALAAVALPSAADAATVQLVNSSPNGVMGYEADPGEVNNVRVSLTAAGVVIGDSVPIRSLDSECRIDSAGDAVCPASADSILVFMDDRNDTIQYKAPHQGFVVGGDGADIIFAGLRQAGLGRVIEPVIYRGKDSVVNGETPSTVPDTVSYAFADRGVKVDLADQGDASTESDGRPGIDREQIERDIEIVEGSNFDDPQLFGSDRNELFRGLNGNDVIGTGGGSDVIDEGSAPNGADTLNGGNGTGDRIFYSLRTSGVNVSLDGVRNDGASGEGDDVRPSVEDIGGTNFRDVLTGNDQPNIIDGFGGNDTITGLGGNDTLSTGTGNNGIVAGTGNDVIFARNNAIDDVDCGENANDTDTLDRDTSENRIVGCERVQVGVLRLAPKAVTAKAGKTARLRLSWRHPVSWRKLRTVELRLTRDGRPVGEVTIRPRGGRLSADGAVELVRKRTRLTAEGRTVTAQLALRLDNSLAGQTLQADVEATDSGGARQLERNAGAIRVAD
jgi:Ca2+-binding RTX toxin-like protein